jgi:hypothetical protein
MLRRFLACFVAAFAAASCVPFTVGSDDGGTGAASPLTGLLQAVPEEQASFVVFGDLDALLQGDAGDGDRSRRLRELERDGRAVIVPQLLQHPDADAVAEEIGFTLDDIDRALEAGELPDTVTVMSGSIDVDAVRKAVTTFEPFADQLDEDEADGFTIYRFGPEFQVNLAGRTPVRQLGRGDRLAVRDGLALWAASDDGIDDAVAGAAGGPSALDLPDVAAVAAELDEAGTYAALLTGPEQFREPGAPLRPWTYAGVGAAKQDGERTLLIVLAHDDADAADANADALADLIGGGGSLASNQPWSELLVVRSIEVRGTTLVAAFDSKEQDRLIDIVQRRELIVFDR